MKNKGITLIALVITIIILLILAGAAVSIGLNENGIFEKANEAKESWNTKVAEENSILNNYISYIELEIPDEIKPGDIVNWTPSGHYTWDKNVYASVDSGVTPYTYTSGVSGHTQDYIIGTKELYSVKTNEEKTSMDLKDTWNGGTNLDFTISEWKVLSVDKTNKKVKLVPTKVSIPVILQGATGYNNSVKLLNDACSSLYGGNTFGIEVHNINMDDIEELMDMDSSVVTATKATTPAYGARYENEYTEGSTQFRNASGEYIVNNIYPSIYAEEVKRDINGVYTEGGLGLSTARSSFIPRANEKVTNATSIHPIKTYYSLQNENFKTALVTTSEATVENEDIILPDGANTHYWVASRCAYPNDVSCNFFVRVVYSGGLGACNMLNSSDHSSDGALGLFPVVSLSSGVLERRKRHIYIYKPLKVLIQPSCEYY